MDFFIYFRFTNFEKLIYHRSNHFAGTETKTRKAWFGCVQLLFSQISRKLLDNVNLTSLSSTDCDDQSFGKMPYLLLNNDNDKNNE